MQFTFEPQGKPTSLRPDDLTVINNLVNRRFKRVWESIDRAEAFKLCNEIRRKIEIPEYTEQKFDEGWQCRIIFHQKYKIAKDEFVNLVFGWW